MLCKNFAELLQRSLCGQRVLVFVTADVDSVCAWKIIQHLLKCQHILYTLLPVSNYLEVKEKFKDNCEGISFAVFINCGATVDLWEMLQPPTDDAQFFIVDSHRPIHLNNYYNQHQIQLIVGESEEISVPDYETVFAESESSDSDSSHPDEEFRTAIERRRQRREWRQRRERALLEYEQFTWHSLASSVILYELAFRLGQHSQSALWSAIVGHHWQLLAERVDWDAYFDTVCNLQGHVTHWRNVSAANASDSLDTVSQSMNQSSSSADVQFNRSLCLWLLRHTSAVDSVTCTPYTACGMQLFTGRGRQRLHQFLADAGLPQREANQPYSCMSLGSQAALESAFAKLSGKYGLEQERLFAPTFTAKAPFKPALVATDSALLCASLLPDFSAACDSVTVECSDWVLDGLAAVQDWMRACVDQIQVLLDQSSFASLGPFLLLQLRPGDERLLQQPLLWLLSHFALRAFASCSKLRKASQLPLLLTCELAEEKANARRKENDDEEKENAEKKQPEYQLFIGLPPVAADDARNVFRQAMLEAARGCRVLAEAEFEACAVRVHKEDGRRFCDALVSLMS